MLCAGGGRLGPGTDDATGPVEGRIAGGSRLVLTSSSLGRFLPRGTLSNKAFGVLADASGTLGGALASEGSGRGSGESVNLISFGVIMGGKGSCALAGRDLEVCGAGPDTTGGFADRNVFSSTW